MKKDELVHAIHLIVNLETFCPDQEYRGPPETISQEVSGFDSVFV